MKGFKHLIAAALALFALQGQADVINGSFETGDFTGWTVGGDAANAVVIGVGAGGPTDGAFQALLSTAPGGVTTTTISQTTAFSAAAGGHIKFDWNFLTNEATPTFFNDTAEVILDGVVTFLADTTSSFVAGALGFNEMTGYQHRELTIGSTGLHTLTFRVRDVGDSVVDSGLLIDAVAVPEPGILVLLGLGLAGFAFARRRKLNA